MGVYQGKIKANIDINYLGKELLITQKTVVNAILKPGINNEVDGCCYIFMNNRYAVPQLLAMIATTWNIYGVGACKVN